MRQSNNKTLDKGNCGAARHGGKDARVKSASPRTVARYKADGADKLAPHNEVPDWLSEVKRGVVERMP